VGYKMYDYSLDIWAVGCVLGAIIFNKQPYMFYGANNVDQLIKIAQVLGTKGLDKYLDKYDLGLTEQQEELLNEGDFVKQPWDDHIHEKTEHLVDDDVLDLLDKMLLWDHAARPTCQEAMKHRYFKSVRK